MGGCFYFVMVPYHLVFVYGRFFKGRHYKLP